MEVLLKDKHGKTVKIIQEAADPLCLRASIGGVESKGYYLVFRGDNLQAVEDMLKETLTAFMMAREEIEEFNEQQK